VDDENGDNDGDRSSLDPTTRPPLSFWHLSPDYQSRDPMPCELCGDTFAAPVSYHMLTAHAGCGQSSNGRGYTSKGIYKNGWSGPCGEGGVAWYLFCESCRDSCMKRAKPIQPSAASSSGQANRSRKTVAAFRQAVIKYPSASNDDDGHDFSDSDDDGDDEDRNDWNPKPRDLPKHLHG